MNHFSSLSATGLLSAHIKQDVSLIFIRETKIFQIPKKIQNFLYIFLTFLGFCTFLPATSYADEEKYFIVTAYYSPLPNQIFYGAGNYEAEIRLNGNGISGAGGKDVFPWMLAAPKNYSFGTKIMLEGLWVGVVEDRGGAIVSSWNRGYEYDRIDVWMGYGEEWLIRARNWGKRKIKGTVLSGDASLPTISFSKIDSEWGNQGKINPNTSGILSSEILNMFADLGYTSENGNIQSMILDFQLDHKVIASEKDTGAGNYGPITKAKLLEEYSRYQALREAEMKRIEAQKNLLISQNIEWTSNYKVTTATVLSFGSPKKGEKGDHIKKLQLALKNTGYLKGKETWVMTLPTLKAIKNLQKEHGIKVSGTIDSNTQEVLVEVLMEKA